MDSIFNKVAYHCSQKVTNAYSTSFSLAVKMLKPAIQPHIHAIYGFVRYADEIVDTFHDIDQEIAFDRFEKDLHDSLKLGYSMNPILQSFQLTVRHYKIDRELIDAFMFSMRNDLYKKEYATHEEYAAYIYGSADVVGLMCLKVFVNGDEGTYEELKPYAMRLGSAFQKVNFLRDLKADTQLLERSYFPQLAKQELNAASKKAIVDEIKEDFEFAYKGIVQLPVEARFGVYTAYRYYKNLLKKLEQTHPERIIDTRIRVSNPAKMRLLVTSFVNHKLNLL